MEIAWQCENDWYCGQVLSRFWPEIYLYENVEDIDNSVEAVDLLAGGFPCHPLSSAADKPDPDSWLWPQMARVIKLLKPRWVLIENVERLKVHGLGEILRFLSDCGYDAEWDALPASAFGAPHERKRIFIVGYAPLCGQSPCRLHRQQKGKLDVADADRNGKRDQDVGSCDPDGYIFRAKAKGKRQVFYIDRGAWWDVEPGVVRMAHGFPGRVDRIGALGNAVVPQISEWIGRQIMKTEERRVVIAR